ncbi:MAG: phage Gp37/Gp68 family protein [Bryobacterales bacterium]|nr:phage Gp37/Gp68 family protein [Bryobacterales bacterium]
MAASSAIEWTDATWNVITGCSRVSRGCGGPDGGGCYAERLAATRLKWHPSRRGLTDAHGRWTGEVRFNRQWLDQPLHWRKPRRIFVCAHSDLFHEAVPDEWIDLVFGTMLHADRHAYQVLTKRPGGMRDHMSDPLSFERARMSAAVRHYYDAYSDAERLLHGHWPPRHVWLGASAEDQRTFDERIPLLLETPATVRWISAEPLLGPIDLRGAGLDWVVAGGESGPGARPMRADWVRSLRDQCADLGVPFFFKQWGGRTPKSRGRVLDGRTWSMMPPGNGGRRALGEAG